MEMGQREEELAAGSTVDNTNGTRVEFKNSGNQHTWRKEKALEILFSWHESPTGTSEMILE